MMLGVYTFVFGVIFGSRWSGNASSQSEFALILYAGLIIFNLFSECMGRSTTVVLSHVNYVKKLVFPLEILPVATLGSALFNMITSFMIWLLFHFFIDGLPAATILLLPVVVVPLCALTLGACWFISAVSVYIRDMVQVIPILLTALLFLSAIFYPISSLPEEYRSAFLLNPLTVAIQEARNVMIWREYPDFSALGIFALFSVLFCWLGFATFQKLRRGFPDVI